MSPLSRSPYHAERRSWEANSALAFLLERLSYSGLSPLGLCLCTSCLRKRSTWYDKYIAYALNCLPNDYQQWILPYKETLFDALVTDRPIDILEIGVGGGDDFVSASSSAEIWPVSRNEF